MKPTTPKVAAFFKKHAGTGELVDLYCSGWFSGALKSGSLAVKGRAHGPAAVPTGQFLLLAVDPYRKDTKAALKSTWKVMSEVIDAPNMWDPGLKHNPDFIAFNAYTGQILAFGLGRKAREFLYAIDASGKILESEVAISDFLKKPSPFKTEFTTGDFAGVIAFLLAQFVRLSKGWQEFGRLPIFPEEAKARLARKDKEYSKQQLEECMTRGTRAEAAIDAAEGHFREIFKGCKVLSWELNPEDY